MPLFMTDLNDVLYRLQVYAQKKPSALPLLEEYQQKYDYMMHCYSTIEISKDVDTCPSLLIYEESYASFKECLDRVREEVSSFFKRVFLSGVFFIFSFFSFFSIFQLDNDQ